MRGDFWTEIFLLLKQDSRKVLRPFEKTYGGVYQKYKEKKVFRLGGAKVSFKKNNANNEASHDKEGPSTSPQFH